jgi:hypothetical protein
MSKIPSMGQQPPHAPQAMSRRRGGTGTLPVRGDPGPTVGAPSGSDQPLRPAARRRWLIALLSAATAIWLAAQVGAGLAMTTHTWPVAGFPMFSEKRVVADERRIEVRTRSGRSVTVRPGDFGLTGLQLLNYQRGIVGDAGMVKPTAVARLGRLAAIWNRQHPGDPAVSMTLTLLVRPLPYGTPGESRHIVRWSAS